MVKFNIPKLRNILENFHVLYHSKISIHDENFDEVVYYPTLSMPFCYEIGTNPKSKARCDKSNLDRFTYVKKTGKTKITICPFGLIEVIAPIIIDNITVGYLVLGQTVSDKVDIEEVAEKTTEYGFNKAFMLRKLQQMEVISERMIEAAVTIADACTKYVLIDKYIDVSKNDVLNKIQNYIVEHLQEKITVDTLCKQFYMSRVSLYSLFNRQLNISVADYIKRERLRKAKEYLQNSSYSVKEIAELVGFEFNYFSKVFYEEEHITPKK